MTEATVDSKGRIVIPEALRERLNMREGTRVDIGMGPGDIEIVVIRKKVEPEEFIELTRGAIKRGSRVKASDPLLLKRIWESS